MVQPVLIALLLVQIGLLHYGAKGAEEENVTPISIEVGNVTRSQVELLQTDAGLGFGFQVPSNRGVNFSFEVTGSVTVEGYLADELEETLELQAKNTSRAMHKFFLTERKKLQRRAGDLYFTWIQAAANFGYTNDNYTKKFMKRWGFREFNRRAARILENIVPRELTANIQAEVSGISNGQKMLFAVIRINKLTIKTEKVITFVKLQPQIVIISEDENIFDVEDNNGSFIEVKRSLLRK